MLKHFFPWFDEDKEDMKDKRTQVAVERAKEVETRVRTLAASYKAAGLVLKEVHHDHSRMMK